MNRFFNGFSSHPFKRRRTSPEALAIVKGIVAPLIDSLLTSNLVHKPQAARSPLVQAWLNRRRRFYRLRRYRRYRR